MLNPTKENYTDFAKAYDFFNRRLFGGTLPRCLITMQRNKNTYGYFSGDRWQRAAGKEFADEIALNPAHFMTRRAEDTLATLAHEMVHLWQHHHGKPSRATYHNKQWAEKMETIGLVPSTTGAPGGKKTGQRVTHYIDPNGRFATVCAALIRDGFTVPYVDRAGDEETAKKKSASKTKYTCPCCDLNVWGKPDIHVVCGECDVELLADH